MQLNIKNIQTIEDYLTMTGVLMVYINTLLELQTAALRTGIFADDEQENAETIKHRINQLMTVVNDQIALMTERTPKSWDEILKTVNDKLLNKQKCGKKKIRETINKNNMEIIQ